MTANTNRIALPLKENHLLQ